MRFVILDAEFLHMMIGIAHGRAQSEANVELVSRLDRIGADVNNQTRAARSTTVVISEEIASLIGINLDHYTLVAVVL